ncbi:MAG: ATP synthase F0 subunit C [Bdellovibrionales bacterium]|nr:ATP synthase F0 subunit C [Bdellovibrionales bacterium]MCB0420708.1 ATP synthase F0 subunit C [Bdellovibrionales bacterium]
MKKAFYILLTLFATVPALAEEAAQEASAGNGMTAIAAALAIGLAAFGGALGQGKVGSSAMEGIARNPQAQKEMFVPMILGLAFVETLVLFAFVIAILM